MEKEPQEKISDARADFEKLSDELINGTKNDEPLPEEEVVFEPLKG